MSWQTKHEIAFIDHIGTGKFGRSVRVRESTRYALLKGYLEGIEHRDIWNDMDRSTIIEYARRQLRHAAQGGSG